MLIQLSYKEFASSLEMMAGLASLRAFLEKNDESPDLVLEIIEEARRTKEVVVLGTGATFYGESDIFAIEVREDEFVQVVDVFKKYSGAIDGIVTGVMSLLMSVKFLFGSMMADLEVLTKAQIERDQEHMKEHRHRSLAFLMWKRQKRVARARFGELSEQ